MTFNPPVLTSPGQYSGKFREGKAGCSGGTTDCSGHEVEQDSAKSVGAAMGEDSVKAVGAAMGEDSVKSVGAGVGEGVPSALQLSTLHRYPTSS